jgi:hypothetical protein
MVLRASCVHADDTPECLRQAPFDVLKAAIATSPGIFDYQVGNRHSSNVSIDSHYVVDDVVMAPMH